MKPDFVVGEEDVKPSEALASNRARNARVFGSVLRGQDTDSSDLDILIDPTPETTLFDISAIRVELRKLLGVPVDVLWRGDYGARTFFVEQRERRDLRPRADFDALHDDCGWGSDAHRQALRALFDTEETV